MRIIQALDLLRLLFSAALLDLSLWLRELAD